MQWYSPVCMFPVRAVVPRFEAVLEARSYLVRGMDDQLRVNVSGKYASTLDRTYRFRCSALHCSAPSPAYTILRYCTWSISYDLICMFDWCPRASTSLTRRSTARSPHRNILSRRVSSSASASRVFIPMLVVCILLLRSSKTSFIIMPLNRALRLLLPLDFRYSTDSIARIITRLASWVTQPFWLLNVPIKEIKTMPSIHNS